MAATALASDGDAVHNAGSHPACSRQWRLMLCQTGPEHSTKKTRFVMWVVGEGRDLLACENNMPMVAWIPVKPD